MIKFKRLRNALTIAGASVGIAGLIPTGDVLALDLDWSGQFRVETHWLFNYTLDGANVTADPARSGANDGGYYIPGGGQRNAHFNTLFMRLNPSVVVTDNIYIKSEWWLGNPVFGIFGDAFPYTFDQRQFFSTQSRGSFISAQRLWGEVVTDIGTVVLGRAPVHWGLGIVWNQGSGIFDRYVSTGDQIRLVSKFGMFSFSPAYINYSVGNNVGGACPDPSGTSDVDPDNVCDTATGTGGVTDYSLAIQFDNPDEDLEIGVSFTKRLAGGAQGNGGIFGVVGGVSGMNYNIWDFYARKKFGPVTAGLEVPITGGSIGGADYSTYAAVGEVDWQVTDRLETSLRAGIVPGQPNIPPGSDPGTFQGFFLHNAYNVGLIMFNYQLRNFAGPNTLNDPALNSDRLRSPFDNPVTNASYLSGGAAYRIGKWRIHSSLLFATADEVAEAGTRYFNTWDRRFHDVNANSAVQSQSSALGWEWDFGTSFQFDDALTFGADFGWYSPGDFFRFSNAAQENAVSSVFAAVFRVGLAF